MWRRWVLVFPAAAVWLACSCWWVWRSAAEGWHRDADRGWSPAAARGRPALPAVPQPMLELYHSHLRHRPHPPPPAELIRGLRPTAQGWAPGRALLEFRLPATEAGERLTAAELRLHARLAGGPPGVVAMVAWSGPRRLDGGLRSVSSRPAWLAPLNVTAALPGRGAVTSLAINVTLHGPLRLGEAPLLLLQYEPPHRTATDLKVGGGRESPRKRRQVEAEDYEEETNRVWSRDSGGGGGGELQLQVKARPGRRARGNCRRKPLYVDFSEINYDTWIVAPTGYEAFQCAGRCSWPLPEHLSPTKHALVQALLHTFRPGLAPRACCVPTRLLPISVLYMEPTGVVTYHYSYHDMVVAECGCR
ncbi:growth/differentiation factor 6-A-like [Schistocerca americana]|uniref:growth/differentiation factor 6-A-like n=1 Tax=Schistocerca americana TaxID=7009 RepID=UPI001F4F6FB8|nr:growth/differentiation factor 6-A-like [Schistocerca americana]